MNMEKDELEAKFKTICLQCGSDAEIYFYSGFIHDCGGDTGTLNVECEKCGNKFECCSEVH